MSSRASSYSVRFTEKNPLKPQTVEAQGTIELRGENIQLRGRASFFHLWKKLEVDLSAREFTHVEREGVVVRLVLAGAKSAGRIVHEVVAESETAARAIEGLLPKVKDAAIEREVEEARLFEHSLANRTPRVLVTPLLATLNLLLFAVMAWKAGTLEPSIDSLVDWGASYGPQTFSGESWRSLTCVFVHTSVPHLALNVWALLQLGALIERMYGKLPFLALYLTAGLTGSLASLYWNPNLVTAGASGAIFGVGGALVAFLVRQGSRIPQSVLQELVGSATAFLAYNLFYGLSHAGIDNAAHVGGLAGGMAIGLFLAEPLDRALCWKRAARTVTVAIAAVFVLWTALPKDAGAILDFCSRAEQVDKRTSAALQDLLAGAKEGKIPSEEFASALEQRCMPEWSRLAIEAESLRGRQTPNGTVLLEKYSKYIHLRDQALRHMARAARTNDASETKRAWDLMQESNALFAESAKS